MAPMTQGRFCLYKPVESQAEAWLEELQFKKYKNETWIKSGMKGWVANVTMRSPAETNSRWCEILCNCLIFNKNMRTIMYRTLHYALQDSSIRQPKHLLGPAMLLDTFPFHWRATDSAPDCSYSDESCNHNKTEFLRLIDRHCLHYCNVSTIIGIYKALHYSNMLQAQKFYAPIIYCLSNEYTALIDFCYQFINCIEREPINVSQPFCRYLLRLICDELGLGDEDVSLASEIAVICRALELHSRQQHGETGIG